MALTFIQPCKTLASYIDRYWIFDTHDHFAPQITPGVGLDLFIHYAAPFSLTNGETTQQSHIFFSGLHAHQIAPSDNVHFIAIRFKAGALKNFTDIPTHQLLDTQSSPEDIWGIDGKNFVAGMRTREATIIQLEQFLITKLTRHKKDTPSWNQIIDALYHDYDPGAITALSKRMNITDRHFRRRFLEETGFTPKHFQQLSRFHATIKPLLLNKERRYLSMALENGYFDQTHFIKDFKRFMNYTPSHFLRDKNFTSHFYYPSLAAPARAFC